MIYSFREYTLTSGVQVIHMDADEKFLNVFSVPDMDPAAFPTLKITHRAYALLERRYSMSEFGASEKLRHSITLHAVPDASALAIESNVSYVGTVTIHETIHHVYEELRL